MNQYTFCAETEHGIFFGTINLREDVDVKETLEFLIKEASHKQIHKLEFFHNNGKFHVLPFKGNYNVRS